jgi:membrane protein
MVVVAPIFLAVIPFNTDQTVLLELFRWSLVVAVLFVGLGLLYRYGPNRRYARMGWVTPGAFVVVAFWLVMSAAFSAYVANFATYNEVYGSLGAVIALLFWFYLSAYLILVGAALNNTLDRRKPL